MELSSLLVKEKIIEVEYPDMEGFVVGVNYVTREELQKIRTKCTSTKFNRSSRKPEESIDDEMFLKLYVDKCIKGWRGLKYEYLKELVIVDTTGLKDSDCLPFSHENALALMKNSVAFDSWISNLMNDISAFNKNS